MDHLVVNFRPLCNHMEAWSRKTLKICEQFLRFFWGGGNDSLWYNFQNSVSKVFIATPIDVVVFKYRKICPTGNRWNRALFSGQKQQNFGCLSNFATVWIAPKICHGQPPTMYSEYSRFHPNQYTFGGVIAERMNTAKLRPEVIPIFY